MGRKDSFNRAQSCKYIFVLIKKISFSNCVKKAVTSSMLQLFWQSTFKKKVLLCFVKVIPTAFGNRINQILNLNATQTFKLAQASVWFHSGLSEHWIKFLYDSTQKSTQHFTFLDGWKSTVLQEYQSFRCFLLQ